MATEKNLIVHADDFGLTPGISMGIVRSIREGIVSSTSVIVETPYLSVTKKLVRENPDIDWGIHVVIENPTIPLDQYIVRETERQVELFQRYFQIRPTHLDFHKGFRFDTKIYFSVRMLVLKLGLAFRNDNRHTVLTDFYGCHHGKDTLERINESTLVQMLSQLKPGFTELVCHPGVTSNRLSDPYRAQRRIELSTLTSQSVIQAIKRYNIHISTFRQYS